MSWSRILPEASTLGGAVGLEKMLAGPLGDDHDGVVAVVEPSFEGGQKTRSRREARRETRGSGRSSLPGGSGGHAGDETGVAAHELDEPDAAGRAPRLGMCQVDHATSHVDRRQIAECPVAIVDVVVDRLWGCPRRRSARPRRLRSLRKSRARRGAYRHRRRRTRMSILSCSRQSTITPTS